ncbi:LysR family transcriptional regulator [Paenibacillus sp. UMB7766-LJ446]|jgi:DNA-binding transcriptional LysR family regulator|uniref:LysR family transcriptional regulator n=1 Tax=Paenibacillus vandeheii TaxID=3035917 RepID=A0ABT8JHI2_9BACL|nr:MULTISPECIES: LysR family transcriptional regulator [Paenibacillus]OPG97737.1 LysR family transcriptional regulator [Chryseobacterium mucoviscidosis]KGP79702.1 LysR family transcriptional regulator [Paenibacillus sp. MAEPY2]KGP84134.1 LysR family transcriptional regulator [Paenibacillus sp. MAEPY1]MDK8192117.1 LysR family transcriptional regulator [Paenibacillus sp. UMB7766-LJ446]MDN4604596.1 LysR family transcriptional regulator [Paenibacillus vandeheii]
MNISQLETLITISKTMSFRKAGELLNLTQPAVSAQIKSLEDEFRTVLVDRNQPVTLTDRGQVFLQHAERMLDIVGELKQKLMDLDETPQGHIRLGTTTSIAIQILPRVLSYFQDQFPLIKTSIQSLPSSQIYTQVENGMVDIGIGYLTERNPNLNTSVLYYDTFELVVSPFHPLAKQKHAAVDVLRSTPLILLSPDTVGRRFTEGIFKKHNIEPNIVMELSSSEEVKRMVEINLGAAVISKQSVAHELRQGTLRMIPLSELEVSHPVGVIYKSSRYLNSAMQQFLSDLKGMPETQFISSE